MTRSIRTPRRSLRAPFAGVALTALLAVGPTVYPGVGALGDVTFGSYGNRIDRVAVTHPGVALSTVVNGYVAAFEKLGFTAETQAGGSTNLAIVTFTHGDAQLRAVFHRMGADVDATLSGVRAS